MQQPIEQRILDEQGYLVFPSPFRIDIGSPVPVALAYTVDGPRFAEPGSAVVIAETDCAEWLAQHARYGPPYEGEPYEGVVAYYRVVAE